MLEVEVGEWVKAAKMYPPKCTHKMYPQNV